MIKTCNYCGKKYKGRTKQNFCSRACRNKAYPTKPTKETKRKLSKALKGKNAGEKNAMYGKSGKDSPTWGTKRTKECRKRLSEIKLKLFQQRKESGEWIPAENSPYPEEWTKALKTKIRKRDKFVCQLCGLHGHDVHHIDYNKDNCSESNLITLCRSCHSKTNFNRETWEEILSEMIKLKEV